MCALLRNVTVAFVAVCLICSCAGIFSGPYVPIVKRERGSFPKEVPYTKGRGDALSCVEGAFTGKHIDDHALFWRLYGLKNDPPRPDPEGKGKIYTRYVRDTYRVIDDYESVYGFTFTIHTNEDGIITKCSAIKQYLGTR
jgi:hypothetical protein